MINIKPKNLKAGKKHGLIYLPFKNKLILLYMVIKNM